LWAKRRYLRDLLQWEKPLEISVYTSAWKKFYGSSKIAAMLGDPNNQGDFPRSLQLMRWVENISFP
jgi:hypothetical protein